MHTQQNCTNFGNRQVLLRKNPRKLETTVSLKPRSLDHRVLGHYGEYNFTINSSPSLKCLLRNCATQGKSSPLRRIFTSQALHPNLTSTLQTPRRQMLSDLALPWNKRPNVGVSRLSKCVTFFRRPSAEYNNFARTFSPACYHSSPATQSEEKKKKTLPTVEICSRATRCARSLSVHENRKDGEVTETFEKIVHPRTETRSSSPPWNTPSSLRCQKKHSQLAHDCNFTDYCCQLKASNLFLASSVSSSKKGFFIKKRNLRASGKNLFFWN